MDFDIQLSAEELREYYPFDYWQGVVERNADALIKRDALTNVECLLVCSMDLLLNNECDKNIAYDIIWHYLITSFSKYVNYRQLSNIISEHSISTGINSVIDKERLLNAFSRVIGYDFDLTSFNSDTIKCLIEKSTIGCFCILFMGYTLFSENYFNAEYFYQKILDESPKLRCFMETNVYKLEA